MPNIRGIGAVRRQCLYVRTWLRQKFNIVVLALFRIILRRRMAVLEAHDSLAFSDNFKATLSRIASSTVLRTLYPLVPNLYGLRYLDFIYWQVSQCLQDRPIADVVWHEPELFDEICSLPLSCIILVLHNGFVHGTRALSYSKKKLAAVIGDPETILDDYKDNKVNHPEEIEIIPANSETLLRLTEVAKANKAIICAPDVFNPKTERCDLLSSAMFRFVGYTHLPLYCFDFYMDDDCVLRGFIKGPLEFERGPAKAAEDFIRFCKSVSGRDLTLMN